MKEDIMLKNKYKNTNKKNAELIINILQDEFFDAKCGLNFNTPFELVCALILAAQCTDARVNTIIPILFTKYKNVYEIANADITDIETIIKPCGFYKNKSNSISNTAKILVEKFNGNVPNTMEELTTLPGIGRKSANIILQECFNITVGIAVDTHVTRISRKLGFSNGTSQEKIEQDLMNKFDKKYWNVINHVLVLHGRKYCIARRPQCDICPLKNYCPKNE
jgi:endonuclease-3